MFQIWWTHPDCWNKSVGCLWLLPRIVGDHHILPFLSFSSIPTFGQMLVFPTSPFMTILTRRNCCKLLKRAWEKVAASSEKLENKPVVYWRSNNPEIYIDAYCISLYFILHPFGFAISFQGWATDDIKEYEVGVLLLKVSLLPHLVWGVRNWAILTWRAHLFLENGWIWVKIGGQSTNKKHNQQQLG